VSEPSRLPPQVQTSFRAVVHSENGEGYWAEVPELPGCFTQGDTLDEVYKNLAEAIACHLDVDTTSIRISLLEMASGS
jgi:predicted RNase H-like HicB family nuclease